MSAHPDDRRFALLNVAFVAALFVTTWLALGYELAPGVMRYDAGPCAVDWHRQRSVLVLACAGQDMLRVWPLPIQQPWFEDDTPREGLTA